MQCGICIVEHAVSCECVCARFKWGGSCCVSLVSSRFMSNRDRVTLYADEPVHIEICKVCDAFNCHWQMFSQSPSVTVYGVETVRLNIPIRNQIIVVSRIPLRPKTYARTFTGEASACVRVNKRMIEMSRLLRTERTNQTHSRSD